MALTVFAALVSLSTDFAAEQSGGKCLRFRDDLSKVDDRTLLATTNGHERYTVNLRQKCRDFGQPGNFYTVRLHSDWECLDRDDVQVFRDGGSCFIESVTLLPTKKPS